jgi:hypothetical protein
MRITAREPSVRHPGAYHAPLTQDVVILRRYLVGNFVRKDQGIPKIEAAPNYDICRRAPAYVGNFKLVIIKQWSPIGSRFGKDWLEIGDEPRSLVKLKGLPGKLIALCGLFVTLNDFRKRFLMVLSGVFQGIFCKFHQALGVVGISRKDADAKNGREGGTQRYVVGRAPATLGSGYYYVVAHWQGILGLMAGWVIAIGGIGICFFWDGNLLLRFIAGSVGIVVPGCHILPWAFERLERRGRYP